jgi:hypothetical protein
VSGIGHVGSVDGKIDLLFADFADLCGNLESQTFPAGTSVVQIYSLAGTVPGEFTPGEDVKYATILPACPSGGSVNDYVASASRATSASVTIATKTSTRITGEIHVTFEDGSTVDGGFDVPICSVSQAEDATCK